MQAARAVGGRAGQRKGRHLLTLFSFFFLSNPAPAEFRYSKEDKGRVRRKDGERKQYVYVKITHTLFHKPFET